jgi:acylphosphatase
MPKEIKAIITGKVQMVMFRDFANRKANDLGICGTVENLSDGSVRIIAQGNEEKLNEFVDELKTGPQFAEIENVSIEWREVGEKFEDFKIIY